jgi:hypothetical protein
MGYEYAKPPFNDLSNDEKAEIADRLGDRLESFIDEFNKGERKVLFIEDWGGKKVALILNPSVKRFTVDYTRHQDMLI